jgi:hypothetical protein
LGHPAQNTDFLMDVAVLDELPGAPDIELTKRPHETYPAIQISVLSANPN